MATLSDDHKQFIVQRLACFEAPAAVIEQLHETFSVVATPQQVYNLDPTKPANEKRVSKPLRELFDATRRKYVEGAATIGISHQAYRLERLHRMASDAERRKNYALAAQLLEQAAKERGGLYTNKRELKVEDKRRALAEILNVQPEQLPESVH